MDRLRYTAMTLVTALFLAGSGEALALPQAGGDRSEKQRACSALTGIRNLTIISASLVNARGTTPEYCYVRGLITPAIHFHLQLPLPEGLDPMDVGGPGQVGFGQPRQLVDVNNPVGQLQHQLNQQAQATDARLLRIENLLSAHRAQTG